MKGGGGRIGGTKRERKERIEEAKGEVALHTVVYTELKDLAVQIAG